MNTKFKLISLLNISARYSILQKNNRFKFATVVKYPKSSFISKKLLSRTMLPTVAIFALIPTFSVWYSTNSIKTNTKLNKFINNYILLYTTFLVSFIVFLFNKFKTGSFVPLVSNNLFRLGTNTPLLVCTYAAVITPILFLVSNNYWETKPYSTILLCIP